MSLETHSSSMHYYLKHHFKNIIYPGCESLNVAGGRVTYNQSLSNGVYRPNTLSTASCNSGYYYKSLGWWGLRTCNTDGNWGGSIVECGGGNWQHLPLSL